MHWELQLRLGAACRGYTRNSLGEPRGELRSARGVLWVLVGSLFRCGWELQAADTPAKVLASLADSCGVLAFLVDPCWILAVIAKFFKI